MNTVIITGESGTGKSTLANMLLQAHPSKVKTFDVIKFVQSGYTFEEVLAMESCNLLIVDCMDDPLFEVPDSLCRLILRRRDKGLKNILIVQSETFLRQIQAPVFKSIMWDTKTTSFELHRESDLEEVAKYVYNTLITTKRLKVKKLVGIIVSGFAIGFISCAFWRLLPFNPSEYFLLATISMGFLWGVWGYRLFSLFFPTVTS
ncbi:ATP-binding protein [Bacteroides sp. 51]|uniref:ATP-binding protein n=1 Tax=Bacteroides sp. 51 TaxID=2302938 RepID=UPI0013D14912|nr:ATP-binding protein [Bacteroides sp. 51]